MPTENSPTPGSHSPSAESDNELRRSPDADLGKFFEMSLDMLCVASADGYFKKLNPAWERTLGFSIAELLSRPFVELIHPDDRANTQKVVEEMGVGVDVIRFENRYRHKDGSYRWFSWMAPACAPGETTLYATARDVTEMKRAHEELRESEERLRLALDSAQIGDWELDLETHHARSSLKHDQIFGYTELQPEWTLEIFLNHVHPDDRARVEQAFRDSFAGGTDCFFECRIIRKDGAERHIWFRGGIFRDAAGRPAQMLGMLRDITARKQAEARVANLLERLDLATRAARIGIWDWDITERKLVWDDRMYELYGVKKEDFDGAYGAWLERVHPEDCEFCDKAIDQALSGEKEYNIDFRVRWPDGALRVLRASGQVVRDSSGKPLRMTGINYDVTDHKRAEQRVALQLAVSRVLVESATLEEATPRLVEAIAKVTGTRVGAIWRFDSAANALRCVSLWHQPGIDVAEFEAMSRSLSLAPGVGMPGRVCQSRKPLWIPDVAADSNFPRAAVAGRAGLHAAFGAPILSGDACLGVIEFFSHEINAPDAELLHVCAATGAEIGQFIERKRTEAELRDREARMSAVLENAAQGIITIDQRGIIESANPSAEKTFGYSQAEMIGQNVSMLMPAPYREEHDGYLANYLRTGTRKIIGIGREVVGRRKDGSSFPMELAVSEVRVEGRRLFTGFVRDITERKRAEERLNLLSAEAVHRAAQLEAANKELEAFSYSVSHDLRAPLRHVQGYVELLKKTAGEQLSEKATGYLKVISSASRQMGQLIDDLLAFSRIGRVEMSRVSVDLDELVRLCLASLELETKGRRINWKIAPLPRVIGDRAMLRQVFANLMGNAVKYTGPRDPAEIEIGCCGRENGHVILFIKDNGVGFDMSYVGKLFGVFQRLHTSEEFEGTGIGLANVRRVVTRHGGRIWPEAALDKGATFFFTLEEAAPVQQTTVQE